MSISSINRQREPVFDRTSVTHGGFFFWYLTQIKLKPVAHPSLPRYLSPALVFAPPATFIRLNLTPIIQEYGGNNTEFKHSLI